MVSADAVDTCVYGLGFRGLGFSLLGSTFEVKVVSADAVDVCVWV